MVGRREELALIAATLDGTGTSPRILLEGDAGIGKTTLLNAGLELAAAMGHRVLQARPAEAERSLPFCTLGDLLKPVLEWALPSLPVQQRIALDIALQRAEPREEPADRLAIALALLAVLRDGSAAVTTLVIDDVQWVDPPSADALQFAIRRALPATLRVLLSRRGGPDEAAPLGLDRDAGLQRVFVGPLGPGETDRIVRARLGIQLDRVQLGRIHQATGGNPYFALELLRANPDLASSTHWATGFSVPDSLGALLRHRLQTLPPAALDTVVLAAASAQPTRNLLESTSTPEGLAAAVGSGLLVVDDDRVRFAHPLVASIAYADADPAIRRTAHARLAAAATDDGERAIHLGRATEGRDEGVAAELAAAANRALLRGAPATAAELGSHACRLTPRDLPERLRERTAASAEYHLAAGGTAAGRALLEQVVADCPPRPDRVLLLIRLGHVRYLGGDVAAAHRSFEEALEQAGPDTAAGATAQQALAFTAMFAGDLPVAGAHARAALVAAERIGEPGLLAGAIARAALLAFLMGSGVDHGSFQRAIGLDRPIRGEPTEWSPSFAYAGVLAYADEFDAARAIYARLHRAALESADERAIPTVLFALSQLESAAGNVEAALRHAREAVARTRQSSLIGLLANALSADVLASALAGDVAAARAGAEDGLRVAAEAGAGAPASWILAALGSLELSLGDAAAAQRHLGPLTATIAAFGVGDPGVVRFLPDAVEALVGTGDIEEARRLIVPFETRAVALDRPGAMAAAARCRALIEGAAGDIDAARASLAVALGLHDRVAQPIERARTLLVLGSLERRARHRVASRRALTDARDIFEARGARLWAARAAAEIARLPVRAATADDLTETEREIARLVAAGRTNKEVAAALSVAVRTVEWNLSKIYAKLDVRSRTELSSRMTRRPD